MLSPTTQVVLVEVVREKRRRISDLHLALPGYESDVRNTKAEIAQHQADIAALEADLERDDQARADAGDDALTEDHTDCLAAAAACRVCSADGAKTEG